MDSLSSAYSHIDRAEARADRLQLKVDEQNALITALRRQLRESSHSAHQVAAQVRVLQGVPNAPDAPGGSLAGLQKTVATLRDRLDVEKKAANSAQAECHRLEKRLSTASRERDTMVATEQELRAELRRRSIELEKARASLRDTGKAREEANGQVSTLTVTRSRERYAHEKEIAELKAALEVERKRAANRASRTAVAEAALRRAREGGALGIATAPVVITQSAESSGCASQCNSSRESGSVRGFGVAAMRRVSCVPRRRPSSSCPPGR